MHNLDGSREQKANNQLGQTPHHCTAANIVHSQSSSQVAEVGSIIQNLVITCPATASIPDNTGLLPLHCIAQHFEGCDMDAKDVLLEHKPTNTPMEQLRQITMES
eukprot:4693226-Ditylum_brightwellii.AAC.1